MLEIFKKMLSKGEKIEDSENSLAIIDSQIINNFVGDPDFPFLVSFPRTGSHWLRMLMELYFEKPSLVRAFYYKTPVSFTCYHHHDQDLMLRRSNVIYLYREPVGTIFSQMKYYSEDLFDVERIQFWTELYARHLEKWLISDDFTSKKTIITYEGLKESLDNEFGRICEHFSCDFDPDKLATISNVVSKEKLKDKTGHDKKVVNLDSRYEGERAQFRADRRALVLDLIAKVNPKLATLF